MEHSKNPAIPESDVVTGCDMEVPLLDLKAQYLEVGAEVRTAIDAVCARQQFILGPRVGELEERIATYSGVAHAVGMSSGTDALLAALMAIGIGPGDEVITSPYSFFATGGVIARLGARPLFCDIEPATYNLAPDSVEEFIDAYCELRDGVLFNGVTGGRVRAIMPVHLFGQLADMRTLSALARRYDLRIIEDAAQAIGSADADGRRAGGFGDIGCLSFFPSKNLGAFGDGGMCVTDDPGFAERMRVLRVHGGKPKYHHTVIGGNFRLDEIQAAVLLVKLKYLDVWTSARQANARAYDLALATAGLERHVATPVVREGFRHIFNQYVLRAERRDALKAFLGEARIGTEIYYPVPLHLQTCFAYLGCVSGDYPQAERAARETLAIPVFPELSSRQRQHVVDTIIEFYA